MNQRPTRPVPAAGTSLAASLALLLGGCLGAPDLEAGADPLVVTEGGTVSYAAEPSPERAAAIADMRAQAEAGEAMPDPDVFQSERSTRLAARREPMPVADVLAIEAELAHIARRQQAAVSPAEIAYLKARAAELQRLAAAAQSNLRR
jgi:hypothetical protein